MCVVPRSVHRAATVSPHMRSSPCSLRFTAPSARRARARLLSLGSAPASSRFKYRSLFKLFRVFYTHKWFVIDYVKATAFVDQQQSLGTDLLSVDG
ncbi:hypothetical protein EVAR_14188_1 [Eumeta japonica]|uniref:Uncharacterized protein n=1 Tax=Eumeta variegata TaxID=151549 RepID=A0A4C1UEI4_EUMVA|nr:hypothetical protein EVAR_14188_1 [Eumeta japonica]